MRTHAAGEAGNRFRMTILVVKTYFIWTIGGSIQVAESNAETDCVGIRRQLAAGYFITLLLLHWQDRLESSFATHRS